MIHTKVLRQNVKEFLDKKRKRIESLEFYPSVDNLIKGLRESLPKDTPSKEFNEDTVRIYINDWIKENKILGADGLIDIKKRFGIKLYKGSRLDFYTTRLSKEKLEKRARKWNLELLTDYYNDYENKDSILRWRCLECDEEFEESINRLERRMYPCPKEYEEKYGKRRPAIRESKLFNLKEINKKLQKIVWGKLTYKYRKNQNSPIIEVDLNPYSDCSVENPLYRNKKWLERVYLDEELNLSDKDLSKICGIDDANITRWRKRHDIPTKGKEFIGWWVDSKSGYVRIYMTKGYLHPQQKKYKKGERRNVRFEHVVIMERYLSKDPELVRKKFGISKKCLIKGADGNLYLDKSCPVHHKNYVHHDNRLENLWLYESRSKHNSASTTLTKCLRDFINLNQIVFENGRYFLNECFDYKTLSKAEINRRLLIRNNTTKNYRYIMEQYLVKHPRLEISQRYLDDNGYLKSSCIVHHINLDHEDNRIVNLWVCEDKSEHQLIHSSLFTLIDALLKYELLVFKKGKYYLSY